MFFFSQTFYYIINFSSFTYNTLIIRFFFILLYLLYFHLFILPLSYLLIFLSLCLYASSLFFPPFFLPHTCLHFPFLSFFCNFFSHPLILSSYFLFLPSSPPLLSHPRNISYSSSSSFIPFSSFFPTLTFIPHFLTFSSRFPYYRFPFGTIFAASCRKRLTPVKWR